MKKTLTLSLMIVAIAATFASTLFTQTAGASKPQDPRQAAFEKSLGSELVVPQTLPSGISDAILLEAWIRLYNDQDAVTVWDGTSRTGRQLAQFVIEQGIPVVWDTDNVCRGSSCSQHFCTPGADICDFEDGQPGIDPIYIAAVAQPYGIEMQNLISTLAHEIFHRTMPFGGIRDTIYEEYWAYYVGEKVSNAAMIDFGVFDPMDSNHLKMWVRANRLDGYFGLPEYPSTVAAQVEADQTAQAAAAASNLAGTNFNGIPSEYFGGSQ